MKRKILLLCAVLALAACGSNDEEYYDEYEYEITEPETEPEPEPVLSPPLGMAVSLLTGEYITEEAAVRRPFAVVFNNEPRAMPQMGLMQASIIYEVLAEGATTRLVAIFQDFDAEMIGPIRSSRYYTAQIAADHGAVFVHHGNSPAGGAAIGRLGLYRVDGMRYDGSIIWRDAVRRQERGMEHSSFTSAENLLHLAEQNNFNMTAPQNLGLFEFFDEPTAPSPQNIANVTNVPFHGSNISIFRYNPESKTYFKYIFGEPHMDGLAEEQVNVKNILVQVTNISIIAGDPEGRRDVGIVGAGHGYLITHGTYTRVYWEKTAEYAPTRWKNADGEPLQLNRGITWISIINGQPTFE